MTTFDVLFLKDPLNTLKTVIISPENFLEIEEIIFF